MILFKSEVCLDFLQEKTFKATMDVPVIQNPISQIGISIYNGTRQLVPFAANAVTSIRLHLGQLSKLLF